MSEQLMVKDIEKYHNAEQPVIENGESQEKFGFLEVCESYGIAEWELFKKIGNAEPTEWLSIAENLLNEYPALGQYKELFFSGIRELLDANAKIEELWSIAKEECPEHSEENEGGNEGVTYEVADTEMSKALAKSIFPDKNLQFRAPVKAEKGKFTITFYLKKEDYDGFKSRKNGIRSRGLFTSDGEVPTIVVRDSSWLLPQVAVRNTVYHEAQHARHDVMQQGYQNRLWWSNSNNDPLSKKILANMDKYDMTRESRDISRFKDEMSSMILDVSVQDFQIRTRGKPLSSEQFRRKVQKKVRLYRAKYLKKYYDTPEVSQSLSAAMDSAPELITNLREHLIRDRNLSANDADNVTMRMLQFIPAKSWATTNRIVESRLALGL